MANPEHVDLLQQGAAAIAAWHSAHPDERLDLEKADLTGIDLPDTDLQIRVVSDLDDVPVFERSPARFDPDTVHECPVRRVLVDDQHFFSVPEDGRIDARQPAVVDDDIRLGRPPDADLALYLDDPSAFRRVDVEGHLFHQW